MKEDIKKMLRENLVTEERIKFEISVPHDILQIKDVFKKNNYKCLIVGGAVRDALLNKKIKDYDLATDAVPDKVEEIMAKAGFKTLPTGKAFGVINVFTSEGEYEIATFRSDETSGRNPEVKLGATIESDAARRDLRINALYYDLDTNEIIDLVGGQVDLMIVDLTTSLPQVKNDKLKALGVSSLTKSPLVPTLPTIASAGIPGYEFSHWNALYGPSGMDAATIKRINELFVSAMKKPAVKKFVEENGMEVSTSTPDGLSAFQNGELKRWGQIIKEAGIQPE